MTEFLERFEVLSIPDEMCPMVVLSDNMRSLFSWGIKVHESGCYNHLMWLIPGQKVASQNLFFETQPIKDYFKKYRLKFWHNPSWTMGDRAQIVSAITRDLKDPWYRRIYDAPAIIGQALKIPWFQMPGIDICSDKGKYLRLVDSTYPLTHPSPEQVNAWLNTQSRYQVYGRYVPD